MIKFTRRKNVLVTSEMATFKIILDAKMIQATKVTLARFSRWFAIEGSG